jgi:hypothetical protein
MTASTGKANPSLRLESAIAELHALQDVLVSGDLDATILTDFRDAVNRVRNTAWAAQQYVAFKETQRDSMSLLSLLAGERVRVTYQLCQTIATDLERTDIQFQAGSLVQLHATMKSLTEQLGTIVNRLG